MFSRIVIEISENVQFKHLKRKEKIPTLHTSWFFFFTAISTSRGELVSNL